MDTSTCVRTPRSTVSDLSGRIEAEGSSNNNPRLTTSFNVIFRKANPRFAVAFEIPLAANPSSINQINKPLRLSLISFL